MNNDLLVYSKLEPVLLREIFYIEECPIPLYQIHKSKIKLKIKKNSFINNHRLKELLAEGTSHLYAFSEDKTKINDLIQHKIYQISRSLSIGNPVEKTKTLVSLMCLNQKYILENITDEEKIKLQYQVGKNLCYFLLKNISFIESLYKHILKQKFYFLYGHPMLASLFLLGLLKYSGQYSDKSIEDLFITSLFKDLGMSVVPTRALNKEILEDHELAAFINHPKYSRQIVKASLPLAHKYLNIIQHHHLYSSLKKSDTVIKLNHEKFKRKIKSIQSDKPEDEIIMGTETILVCLSDIIAAMITDRPYRKAIPLYDSLKSIKPFIFEQYPQEFQLIIKYFNKYFNLKPGKS